MIKSITLLFFICITLLPACSKKTIRQNQNPHYHINKKIAAIKQDYQNIKNIYEQECLLLESVIPRQEQRTTLLQLICTQDEDSSCTRVFNIYTSMPLLRYKDRLNKHRTRLESLAEKLAHHDKELLLSITQLLKHFEQINNLLVSCSEYHQELLAFDERRYQIAEYVL